LTVIWLDGNSITDISSLSGLIKIGDVEQNSWLDQREGSQ
jgi:hypothetical protein